MDGIPFYGTSISSFPTALWWHYWGQMAPGRQPFFEFFQVFSSPPKVSGL
jgi:hypothetical protein